MNEQPNIDNRLLGDKVNLKVMLRIKHQGIYRAAYCSCECQLVDLLSPNEISVGRGIEVPAMSATRRILQQIANADYKLLLK